MSTFNREPDQHEEADGAASNNGWRGQMEFVRGELALSFGAVPLVFSHMGPIVKAFEFGGWADKILGYWVPLMNALAAGAGALVRLVTGLEVSPPYRPYFAILLQLAFVLFFAFRRFGFVPYFIQAPRKFGWPRTIVHYGVHVAACILLLLFMSAAIHIEPLTMVENAWNAFSGASGFAALSPVDRSVVVTLAGFASVLFLWHPGASVRVLMVLLVALAFDKLTGELNHMLGLS